jgi:hypothetical protein
VRRRLLGVERRGRDLAVHGDPRAHGGERPVEKRLGRGNGLGRQPEKAVEDRLVRHHGCILTVMRHGSHSFSALRRDLARRAAEQEDFTATRRRA